MKPLKYLIIYHSHCNDGFGAAWCIWNHLASFVPAVEIVLHEAGYGSPVPYEKIDKETCVFIVDFSYEPNLIVDICAAASQVTWIDHHKTAINAWNDSGVHGGRPLNLNTILDMDYSGAMLCWNYVNHTKAAPMLIQYIQDRDLWRFELFQTEEFHLNLSTQPKDMEHWNNVADRVESNVGISQFLAEGAAIKRYYRATIASIIKTNKVYCYIDGVRGLACNCPGAFASDIGHILATESGTFGLTWETQKGGIEKCSLRSNGDYDVSAIAKSFGGGGHKNAAGFVINIKAPTDRLRFSSI